MPFETYFDPFSGTMIEDIGDDDVFVAERDVKIPEGMLVTHKYRSHKVQAILTSSFAKFKLSKKRALGNFIKG